MAAPTYTERSPGALVLTAAASAPAVPLSRLLAESRSLTAALIHISDAAMAAAAPPAELIYRGVETAAPLMAHYGVVAYAYENRGRITSVEDVPNLRLGKVAAANRAKAKAYRHALDASMTVVADMLEAVGALADGDGFSAIKTLATEARAQAVTAATFARGSHGLVPS